MHIVHTVHTGAHYVHNVHTVLPSVHTAKGPPIVTSEMLLVFFWAETLNIQCAQSTHGVHRVHMVCTVCTFF